MDPRKNYITEEEYTQTIDNTQYHVRKIEDGISVTVNNQTYKIDLTGIHENIQKNYSMQTRKLLRELQNKILN